MNKHLRKELKKLTFNWGMYNQKDPLKDKAGLIRALDLIHKADRAIKLDILKQQYYYNNVNTNKEKILMLDTKEQRIKIIQGNCVDKIKELEDNSIDCVVSSPPYFGLRDYGNDEQFGLEKTYQDYLANTVKVFETFKPKLKDTATIWWNVGDSYSSGKRKSNISQSLRGNTNYGVTRTPVQNGIKEKDLLMIPNRVAIALQDAGWYIRSEIIWHKPNPMPESVTDRPTSCHEKIWLITKNKKYYYDADIIKEPCKTFDKNIRDRDTTKLNNTPGRTKMAGLKKNNYIMKNKRNVWTVTTKPCREAHFATFPKDLIEPCIKAGCPENGTVLDPFGGSGTTGIVAALNNRNAVLIELNQDYIDIANKRIDKELGLFKQTNKGGK
jgi:DNA modification methylase